MLSRFTALSLATVASSIAALAQNSPLTTILSFNDGSGGGQPSYSNLIADSAGDLYSAAQQGGVVNQSCPSGCGVVFKLVPPGGFIPPSVNNSPVDSAKLPFRSDPLNQRLNLFFLSSEHYGAFSFVK